VIVCKKCGNREADGVDFCGACGSFLEFTGERVDVAEPIAPPPEPPAHDEPDEAVGPDDPGHAGIASTVRAALGLDRREPEPSRAGQPGDVAATPVPPQQAEPGRPAALPGEPAGAEVRGPPVAPTEYGAVREQAPHGEASDQGAADDRARRAAAMVWPPAVDYPVPPPADRSAEVSGPVAPVQVPSEPLPAVQPAAVLPGTVKRRREPSHRIQPPRQPAQPGDLICGSCGAGNGQERRFCRHCGNSLTEATTVPRPSWWRRIFTRSPKAPEAAGSRHAVRAGVPAGSGIVGRGTARLKRTAKVLVPLVAAAAVVLALVPGHNPVKSAWQRVRNKIDGTVLVHYVEVHPVTASAPSLPGHPASNAIDGASNTAWWAPPTLDRGVGQQLVLGLAQPSHIVRVGFLSGASETVQDFAEQPRPDAIRLIFTGLAGKIVQSTTVNLQDSASFQTYVVDAPGTTDLTIQILSVYPGTAGTNVAITEVEPFTEQS